MFVNGLFIGCLLYTSRVAGVQFVGNASERVVAGQLATIDRNAVTFYVEPAQTEVYGLHTAQMQQRIAHVGLRAGFERESRLAERFLHRGIGRAVYKRQDDEWSGSM